MLPRGSRRTGTASGTAPRASRLVALVADVDAEECHLRAARERLALKGPAARSGTVAPRGPQVHDDRVSAQRAHLRFERLDAAAREDVDPRRSAASSGGAPAIGLETSARVSACGEPPVGPRCRAPGATPTTIAAATRNRTSATTAVRIATGARAPESCQPVADFFAMLRVTRVRTRLCLRRLTASTGPVPASRIATAVARDPPHVRAGSRSWLIPRQWPPWPRPFL